jgi:hypothetical protein
MTRALSVGSCACCSSSGLTRSSKSGGPRPGSAPGSLRISQNLTLVCGGSASDGMSGKPASDFEGAPRWSWARERADMLSVLRVMMK